MKGTGLAEVAWLFFHPVGRALVLRPLCLEKKDLGTEAESCEELGCALGAAREPSAGGVL